MKRFLTFMAVLFVVATASAQVYPPELVGTCPPANAEGSLWMQYVSIDGPISVPVPDWGFPTEFIIQDNVLTVTMGPLSNAFGRPVGPPLPGLSEGKSYVLDPVYCNFVDMWVVGHTLYYEAWLIQDGEIYLHAGDFEVGHGNSFDFGVWHSVLRDNPDLPVNKQMEIASE